MNTLLKITFGIHMVFSTMCLFSCKKNIIAPEIADFI